MKVQPNNSQNDGSNMYPILSSLNNSQQTKTPTTSTDANNKISSASVKQNGLSMITAALFIVGETAGTGVLAAPQAVAGCGWFGVAVIVICCFMAAFSGIYLGKCWLLIEELYPEYRSSDAKNGDAKNGDAKNGDTHHKIRNPYSLIGQKAAGSFGRVVTSLTLVLQLGGGAICMTLICSELVHGICDDFSVPYLNEITFCQWILIIGLIMIPLSFFGSPADFWPVAIMAMGGTAVASVLVTYGIIVSDHEEYPRRDAPTARTFFIALGTIVFGYGGASAMPTFQMDMKKKSDFVPAVALAFICKLNCLLARTPNGRQITETFNLN